MRRAVVSLLPLLIGIALAAIGGRDLTIVHRAQDWPSVPGVVRSSTVIEELRTQEDENFVAYVPKVQYEYEVDGTVYQSTQLSLLGALPRGSEGSDAIVYRYPVGAEVAVYYDPLNPAFAVLDQGSYAVGAVFVFAGAFLTLGAALSLLAGLRKSTVLGADPDLEAEFAEQPRFTFPPPPKPGDRD